MSRQYQDEWVQGQAVSQGYRECAKRYEAVRTELAALTPGFTVFDFGARRGYFSLRLAEDLGARCTMMDYAGEYMKRAIQRNPDAPLEMIVRRVESAADLEDLGSFDVVLALSVLHHIPHEWPGVLDQLQAMAREVLIVEAPAPGERVQVRSGDDFSGLPAAVEARGRLMGHGPPVFSGTEPRGIYAIPGSGP